MKSSVKRSAPCSGALRVFRGWGCRQGCLWRRAAEAGGAAGCVLDENHGVTEEHGGFHGGRIGIAECVVLPSPALEVLWPVVANEDGGQELAPRTTSQQLDRSGRDAHEHVVLGRHRCGHSETKSKGTRNSSCAYREPLVDIERQTHTPRHCCGPRRTCAFPTAHPLSSPRDHRDVASDGAVLQRSIPRRR